MTGTFPRTPFGGLTQVTLNNDYSVAIFKILQICLFRNSLCGSVTSLISKKVQSEMASSLAALIAE